MNIKLKSLTLALTLTAISSAATAYEYRSVKSSDHKAHHVSFGATEAVLSTKYAEEFDTIGLAANYIYLGENSEWGGYIGLEYSYDRAEEGAYYSDDELYSLSIGPVYQPNEAKWFRFYPTVGYTHYKVDMKTEEKTLDYSFHAINVGAGAQFAIPRTYMHVDVNMKRHIVLNDSLKDAEIYSYYIGVGYRF